MACVSDGTWATLRIAIVGLVTALGACADGPNLPPTDEPALLVPAAPVQKVYPIEGVAGGPCRTNYIDDGNGGCIYAPSGEDDGSGSGGGTPTGGTTSGTEVKGGGGTTTEPSDTCPASTDPTCLQPLTTVDRTTIQNALNSYVRPASEFTDSTAKAECQRIRNAFDALFAGGNVYRGKYDTDHYGTEYGGKIHFDPRWLDAAAAGDAAAIKEVAVTAFHETLHAMGYNHGSATWVGTVDYYNDPMYTYLNPGSNSCVKR